MNKPDILSELNEIGHNTIKKGKRIFASSWLSGHEDKNPSVLIDVEKNTWYDFSTGKFGDSIDILAFRKGVDRSQLVKEKKVSPEVLINKDALKLWRANLENTIDGTKVIDYLEKRGLNKELREKLEIGLTVSSKKTLKKFLEEMSDNYHEYSKESVRFSPLFSMKMFENKTYFNEVFNDRIMFPIKNEFNQIVGFTGRTYKNDSIKYLNSSETDVFKKKEFLYNINNALASIKKKKQVYIVEGPFDVVAYMNVGIENVVSTLTCNISEEQLIKLLSLGGKDLEFVIAFDSDTAGVQGIKNCMELFKQFSIWNYKVINYSYKDASEYIETNKLNELKELLNNPRSIASYLGLFYNKTSSLSKKSSYINSFVSLIYTFPDFVIDSLINEFNELTDQEDSEFLINLLMTKKKPSTILKLICYHLKNDDETLKMFDLMVNDKLLTNEEKEVIKNIKKYSFKTFQNNYKVTNLIMQFIKGRSREIINSFPY